MAQGGLTVLSQINFFAGAHVGMELVPDGSRRYHYSGGAEDIVNGLINDDGAVYRRGGCAQTATMLTNLLAAPADTCALTWVGYLPGRATMLAIDRLWAASGTGTAYAEIRAFDAATGGSQVVVIALGGSPGLAGTPVAGANWFQPVEVTGTLFLFQGQAAPGGNLNPYIYGGAITNGPASVAVSFTQGSRTATMTSTSGVTAGQFIDDPVAGHPVGLVASVDSPTQITLANDWTTATATVTVGFRMVEYLPLGVPQLIGSRVDAVGTAARRLYLASGARVFFSERDLPATFLPNNYHQLPLGAAILGLAGLGSTMLVFSTQGLWAISNVELALTDPAGNVQQTLNQVDPEFVLWDHHGIAAWEGRLIIPGTHDVVMASGGGALTPITGGIAGMYRGYVKAGYGLGTGGVYRGHYLLPIVTGDGGTVVDVLVCRLDSGAWTRWSGVAAAAAFGAYTGDSSSARQPKLRAVKGSAVLDVSGCFDQVAANPADSDGTQHALTLIGRTRTLSATGVHTWRNVRIPYDVTGTGSFTLETAVGAPGSAFRVEAGGPTAPASDTSKTWWFARQGKSFRYRLTSTGAPSSLVIRGDEVGVRPHQQV